MSYVKAIFKSTSVAPIKETVL